MSYHSRASYRSRKSKTKYVENSDFIIALNELEAMEVEKLVGPGIYEAAGYVADAVRKELEKVPTDERMYADSTNIKKGPSKVQKKGLLDALGITDMKTDSAGYINVKIGFDGYNKVVTNQWPNGQPNPMVARSVVRGTSFMKSNNFMKKAQQNAVKVAPEIMEKRFNEQMALMLKQRQKKG